FKLYEYKIYYPIYGLWDTSFAYYGAIRNTIDKKVVLIRATQKNPDIIYDFNLDIGDSIKHGYGSHAGLTVDYIDSVEYCGVFHKRYITDSLPHDLHALIEGIGSTYGFIDPVFPHFESY
ncbi:unnamed protein product, partial [marine sediment metagenome]